MSHARVEELSDSDPEIDDPSNFLPDSDNQILRPTNPLSELSSSSSIPPSKPSPSAPNPTLFRPPPPPSQPRPQTREDIKSFQTLYPIYFDSTRTRAQGRRVSSKLATPNPLAWNILSAIRATVGENVLRLAFEPDKTHPKDWANPGRVRIQLKDHDTHAPLHGRIQSKAHLYAVVGKWMKENPTTKQTPLELKLPGLPVPENFLDTDVAVPRGWKVGTILPVHSAAVSGGGVKDDFFKEAMEELRQAQSQGQLPAGGPGGPGGMPDMSALQSMMNGMGGMGGGDSSGGGGGGKKKKDKKKG